MEKKCNDAFLSRFNLTKKKCNFFAICAAICCLGSSMCLLQWLDRVHNLIVGASSFLVSVLYFCVSIVLLAITMFFLIWYVRFLATSTELA